LPKKTEIYLETGQKRVFAGAIEWPGWCRSGRDENSALEALLEYAPRYARVLHAARLEFEPPTQASDLKVTERLAGTSTTDFGAPDIAPGADSRRVGPADLENFRKLLAAFWKAFDAARREAGGKELRKGPRGGGRDLDRILQHVAGADRGYLGAMGWKLKLDEQTPAEVQLEQTRTAILEGLEAAASGVLGTRGPRGGIYWPPRYFVRRHAWHVLDHAWEIEDRIL